MLLLEIFCSSGTLGVLSASKPSNVIMVVLLFADFSAAGATDSLSVVGLVGAETAVLVSVAMVGA